MIDAVREHVKEMTGHAPVTCPWRAMYDPLVRDVMQLARAHHHDLAALKLGDDAPGIWVEGLIEFLSARESVKAQDLEAENKRKKREAEQRR